MRTRSQWFLGVGIGLIIVGAAVGAVLLFANPFTTRASVTDFESCAAQYPVMESYPRMCRDEDTGVLYVEAVDQPAITPVDTTFTSPKGVEITLDDWDPTRELRSPVTLTGTVPGNWSFEASFPVILTDWDGRIIAQEPARLTEDWMTTEDVPFTVTLEFDQPTLYKAGSLILQRDNPSGLPENDDAVEITIQYE